jgi:hypothetical protein
MARRTAPPKLPATGKRPAPGKRVATRDGMSAADLARVAAVLDQIECARRQDQADAVEPFRTEAPVRAYIRAHRAPVSAAAVVGSADLAVLAAHASGSPYALAVVGAGTAAAGARVAWKHRKKARRRPRARRWAAVAWTGSTATAVAGSWAGMASAPGQAVMLAGGLAVAAPYLWHARQRPPRPVLEDEGQVPALPVTDPRIEAFRAQFCRSGPLKDAHLHAARPIPDGFSFEITLAEASTGTNRDVVTLIDRIAALYDVSADQVSVEYVAGRSERRARVSVLTVADAWEREDRWDGQSTYDPARGWIRLGRFADATDAHWLLHKPGSGGAGGVIAGVIGSGKTGSVHVIAAEAGQAKLCTECGAAGTCATCDMQRIVCLWMGDPQMQPLGVWHGFADLLAWGPAACVQLIIMAHAAMRERAARFGSATWTDDRGRVNHGRGSFDPSPADPILYVIVDEWPLIIADPDLFKIVAPLAASVIKEGRKAGVVLVLLTQMPDLSQLGLREIRELLKAFNVIAHRTDSLSKNMLGVQGDPTKLAPGVHGLGYLAGVDGRPAAVMRTKHLPEYAPADDPGVDVREIAERISLDPLYLDDDILGAVGPRGYVRRGQVLDGAQLGEAIEAVAAAAAARPPRILTVDVALRRIVAGMPPPVLAPDAPQEPGTAAAPALPQDGPAVALPILAAVLADRGELDVYDVSELAECDAWTAEAALQALVEAGLAARTGQCRYRSTVATGAAQ